MGKRAKKVEEFLIGKKVEKNLISECQLNFSDTNLLNVFSVFQNGGQWTMGCDFKKGTKDLGHLDIHFKLTKQGLSTRLESSKGLFGALARESDLIGETLGI